MGRKEYEFYKNSFQSHNSSEKKEIEHEKSYKVKTDKLWCKMISNAVEFEMKHRLNRRQRSSATLPNLKMGCCFWTAHSAATALSCFRRLWWTLLLHCHRRRRRSEQQHQMWGWDKWLQTWRSAAFLDLGFQWFVKLGGGVSFIDADR